MKSHITIDLLYSTSLSIVPKLKYDSCKQVIFSIRKWTATCESTIHHTFMMDESQKSERGGSPQNGQCLIQITRYYALTIYGNDDITTSCCKWNYRIVFPDEQWWKHRLMVTIAQIVLVGCYVPHELFHNRYNLGGWLVSSSNCRGILAPRSSHCKLLLCKESGVRSESTSGPWSWSSWLNWSFPDDNESALTGWPFALRLLRSVLRFSFRARWQLKQSPPLI